jgi:hypothetical protein
MKPFTKLFSSIISSSIWRESDETRILWITMLAMADRKGEIWASVGGLADMARISVAQCKKALISLSSPDADSRTKTNEGRRIQEIDGGWVVLNYEKYRNLGRNEDRREYFAEHKRKSRACPPMSTLSTNRPPMSPIAEAEAEAEAEARNTKTRTRVQPTAAAAADLHFIADQSRPLAEPIASRRVVVGVRDHVIHAGAFWKPDEEGAWQLLADQHGLQAILDTIRSKGRPGHKAFYSEVLEALGPPSGQEPETVEVDGRLIPIVRPKKGTP